MYQIKNLGKYNMVLENIFGVFLIEIDPATYMPTLWDYIIKKLNIKSIIDVGCGMGHFINYTKDKVDNIIGIDGSKYAIEHAINKKYIQYHDFTISKYIPKTTYDLAWCCEFVEHVEEKYLDNFMSLFGKSKYVAMTYAGIGQDGHNHVNCQTSDYWINKFAKYDLELDLKLTKELKIITQKDANTINTEYKDNHFLNRGMLFVNKKL